MAVAELTNYRSVTILADIYGSDHPLVRCKFQTDFGKKDLGGFWIPRSSLESAGPMGATKFLPIDIVKARAKRDLGITFDHYSTSSL